MGTGGPDIFVSGSGNVMLLSENRPAKQSSNHAGGVAQRAVDGNPDGRWGQGYVIFTICLLYISLAFVGLTGYSIEQNNNIV